ncbi:MAG TPA: hypothetical protein VM308_03490 [Sphingomicrobium sp.]|nr:hypothetical protein [Sphingomicrobium sp.]
MIRIVAFAAMLASASVAAAEPLTVRTGETWLFSIQRGEPARARKVEPSANPRRGEVKVSVRAAFGTMMTITNNSRIGYTFTAELIDGDGKATAARTCTLPPGNKPALETWPQKAAAVRISAFKPAEDGRC